MLNLGSGRREDITLMSRVCVPVFIFIFPDRKSCQLISIREQFSHSTHTHHTHMYICSCIMHGYPYASIANWTCMTGKGKGYKRKLCCRTGGSSSKRWAVCPTDLLLGMFGWKSKHEKKITTKDKWPFRLALSLLCASFAHDLGPHDMFRYPNRAFIV